MSASQAIRSRANAARREPRLKSTPVNFGINTLGMNRVSNDQMHTLDQFFTSHPAIQAARTVLHSQLFSGGVALVRNGTMLKTLKSTPPDQPDKPASLSSASSAVGSATTEQSGIKEPFARHLNNHWCDFARDVVDSFLKFGLVVVTYELEPEDESVRAVRLAQQEFGLSSKKRARDPVVQRRLVPRVPTLGTYEVGFEQSGRNAYTRSYQVYAHQAPQHALKVDEQSVVHVLNHPDSVGNINSPLASVWELGSFVRTITELALTAEVARAQPQIVTQLRKQDKTSALDPGSLFFDSASRNMQAGNDTEESEGAARALEMQAHLCKVINAMQTTHRPDQPFSQAFEPPDVPPKLFTLPKE